MENELIIEERSLENPSVPLTAAYDYLALSSRQAGVSVNRVSVHGIPVLRRAIQIVSERMAKCGVDVYKQSDHGPLVDADHPAHWLLWRKPALGFTPFEFVKQIAQERLIFGNSFWAIRRDTKYNPVELIHMDPEYTGILVNEGQIYYVNHDISKDPILADDVLHFRNTADATGLMGVSPLMYCQQAIGLSLAILKYETYTFQNQCRPSLVVTLPPAMGQDPVKRKAFRQTLEQLGAGIENAGRIAIFDNGVTTTVVPTDSQTQLIELNEQQERAICQIIGIDPSAVGLDVSTSHNSLEQKEATLLENLDGPMTSIEQELEEKLLRFSEQNHDTHVILFNRKDFNKTDEKTRSEIDLAKLTSGAWSWEEYRIANNLPTDKKASQLWFHLSNSVPFDITDPIPEPPAPVIHQMPADKPEDQPDEKKKPEDKATEARSLAAKLLDKTAQRIVTRLKKAVESKAEKESLEIVAGSLATDHRSVLLDALEPIPEHEQLTDNILNDLCIELRSISKADIAKIDWSRFAGRINGI